MNLKLNNRWLIWSQPISKKFDFGQQLDIGRRSDCLRKLPQNLFSILSTGKIPEEMREQNFIGCSGHHSSVHVARINFNIDWKLQNCLHKVKYLWFTCFRPPLVSSGDDRSTSRAAQVRKHLGKVKDLIMFQC